MTCACLFLFVLFWFELEICCIFLVANILYGSCSFGSSSLMARSVSIIRFVQYVFRGFSMLCCGPWLSRFISSFVNFIPVRLTVLG